MEKTIVTYPSRGAKLILLAFVIFCLHLTVFSNDMTVSNIRLHASGANTLVEFDLKWRNSFNTGTYWDAAWVFIKYREEGGAWQHAMLGKETEHQISSNTTSFVGLLNHNDPYHATDNPGVGAFIYRNSIGSGTMDLRSVKLKWNYTSTKRLDIKVYAIEMVYVPEGEFELGSKGTEVGSFADGSYSGGTGTPYKVKGEDKLDVKKATGCLWGVLNPADNGGPSAVQETDETKQYLPAEFPKGYASFYCMKYAVTEGQYFDFLTTLTPSERDTYIGTGYTLYRNNISRTVLDQDILRGDSMYLPFCGLKWERNRAFLSWSGLRVMTELEYEKACRGTEPAIANEFAWGTTFIKQALGIDQAFKPGEKSYNLGNARYFTLSEGPLRVGHAATANSTRESAGASVYGVQNLSDNERETVISVSSGRDYKGDHGKGKVSDAKLSWPTGSGGKIKGLGRRGGSFESTSTDPLRVSDRSEANIQADAAGSNSGRGVRTEKPGIPAWPDSCGAYVQPGVWKRFMCHNLGADTLFHPLIPRKEILGNYYRWGLKDSVANVNTPEDPIADWYNPGTIAQDAWQDSTKTPNDPCPKGWRIPTKTEWQGVYTYNTRVTTPSPAWTNEGFDVYNHAVKFGPTLLLPAAGYRDDTKNGSLQHRGGRGEYWSSSFIDTDHRGALEYTWYSVPLDIARLDPNYGNSVRCIQHKPKLPTVETLTGSSKIIPKTNSAKGMRLMRGMTGGNITHDGGDWIIERGVIYSTTTNQLSALIENGTKIIDKYDARLLRKNPENITDSLYKNSTGKYNDSISYVTDNTCYYVVAYATNIKGTAYGQVEQICTPTVPTVVTDGSDYRSEGTYSAIFKGQITANGGLPIIEYGLEWSYESKMLVVKSTKKETGDVTIPHSYSEQFDDLMPCQDIYYRAYAVNALDTVYGEINNYTTDCKFRWFVDTSNLTSVTGKQNGLTNTQKLIDWYYQTGIISNNALPTYITDPKYKSIKYPIGAVEWCFRKNYDKNGKLLIGTTPQTMWFLPSQVETMLMYAYDRCYSFNTNTSNGFGDLYWSSTEEINTKSWRITFQENTSQPPSESPFPGFTGTSLKTQLMYVRCVHK